MEKVLSDAQIFDCFDCHCSEMVINFDEDELYTIGRAIEQTLLQSPEVQAWKRDAERINAMEQKRILVTPEYDGGWHAEIYGDQETPIVTGYVDSPRAAIDSAMENSK